MKETRKSLNKKTHTSFKITAWTYTAVITVLVLVFTYAVWFSFAVVSSDGMMPALKQGDVILSSKLAKYFNGIRRSDVLIFTDNNGNKAMGRVIALGGESIQIKDNKTYINGVFLDESSYLSGNMSDIEKTLVPSGYVFILPDCRTSTPLLEAMLISVDNILSTAAFRLFPFNRMGVFA